MKKEVKVLVKDAGIDNYFNAEIYYEDKLYYQEVYNICDSISTGFNYHLGLTIDLAFHNLTMGTRSKEQRLQDLMESKEIVEKEIKELKESLSQKRNVVTMYSTEMQDILKDIEGETNENI